MRTLRHVLQPNRHCLIAKLAAALSLLAVALLPSPASAAFDRTPPTRPTNFRVTAKTAYSVTLSWGASTDNSGNLSYLVAVTTSPSQTVTLPKNTTSYTFHTGLFPRNSYTFILQAVDASGNASSSVSTTATLPADTMPPSTAPVVAVTDVGARYISVAWTPAHDDGPYLNYTVFVNGVAYANAGTNLFANLTSLQPATSYTINVQGRDLGNNLSPASAPVTIATAATSADTVPPTTPANFSTRGMAFSDGETWLYWNQSTDDQTPQALIRYEIFVNGVSDGITTGNGGPFITYGQPGILNTFQVVAVDADGNRSAPATLTVDLR